MSEPDPNSQSVAVLALVTGILSLVVCAPIFAPAAIVLGAIAGPRGYTMGWWGMSLGIVGIVVWGLVLTAMLSG